MGWLGVGAGARSVPVARVAAPPLPLAGKSASPRSACGTGGSRRGLGEWPSLPLSLSLPDTEYWGSSEGSLPLPFLAGAESSFPAKRAAAAASFASCFERRLTMVAGRGSRAPVLGPVCEARCAGKGWGGGEGVVLS